VGQTTETHGKKQAHGRLACRAKGRADNKGLAHDTLACGASCRTHGKGAAHGTLHFGPTTWLRRRPGDVICFTLPYGRMQHTIETLPCPCADVHDKGSLPWPYVPCGICYAQAYDEVFTARLGAFAVCQRHTSENSYLVVLCDHFFWQHCGVTICVVLSGSDFSLQDHIKTFVS
jgi:hypothetical protein